MNNGLTGAGRERKARVAKIYGRPKGSAKRLRGGLNRTEWTYRGVMLVGLKLGGWGARWEWGAKVGETYVSGPTRSAVMAQVDRVLDSPDGAMSQPGGQS